MVDADGRLRYRGAPDADYGDATQNAAWLRDALDAVLDGRDPDPAETDPVGCSIKWKLGQSVPVAGVRLRDEVSS